jgi:four helix bundle protein
MADYRKLRVSQKANTLAETIYTLAKLIKRAGEPELATQMKRSAISISDNVAEGSGHRSRNEFARFLDISIASSCELENQVNFARRIKALPYSDTAKTLERIEEVRKMLTGLRETMVE